jgi:hypothetical protein
MTQEDKQLLLKDLCARLPYGVKMRTWYNDTITSDINTFPYGIDETPDEQLAGCKPYLRPMSSMTEEELKELNDKYSSIAYFFIQKPPYYYGLQAQHEDIGSIKISEFSEIYDWLNAHHFDYCGLIEKGLALEAPEGMYE